MFDAPDQLRHAATEAAEAWGDQITLSSRITMPWGEEYSGATLVDMYLAELAAHAWDLAKATGQLEKLDPTLARPALDGAQAIMEPQYMVEPHPLRLGGAAASRRRRPGTSRHFMGRHPRASPGR